ncbi:MarR family winged helix-turn-helix transcriptional regulator [Streptomyces sp. NPDC058773]|uniref:MarR family winged helix-turn-helix transcriptional regulator n=1 Tax=Streptomyces sp. NPDC058773 TaxID=3346632 RepID=UPI0036C099F9
MVAEFDEESPPSPLGPQLLRSWLGYRRRIEQKLTAEGFTDERQPSGVILRLCVADDRMTISRIGRELQVSRQAASKQVSDLCERGYLSLERSPGDGREKFVRPTPEAHAFLQAFNRVRREVDAEIRGQLGSEAIGALSALFTLLAEPAEPRTGDVWREVRSRATLLGLTDH